VIYITVVALEQLLGEKYPSSCNVQQAHNHEQNDDGWAVISEFAHITSPKNGRGWVRQSWSQFFSTVFPFSSAHVTFAHQVLVEPTV
jgi:hypothetical protein